MGLLRVSGDVLQGLADWLGAGDAVKELLFGDDTGNVKKEIMSVYADIQKAINNNNIISEKLYERIINLSSLRGLGSYARSQISKAIQGLKDSRRKIESNQNKYVKLSSQVEQAMNSVDNDTIGEIAENYNWVKGGAKISEDTEKALAETRKIKDQVNNLEGLDLRVERKM